MLESPITYYTNQSLAAPGAILPCAGLTIGAIRLNTSGQMLLAARQVVNPVISKAIGAYLRSLGLRHIRTRPYTPKTNGKAERFIQTSLREWAYARSYQHSSLREACLPEFLHSCLNHLPPASRLSLPQDNLLTLHI